jgi:hypothetical protein
MAGQVFMSVFSFDEKQNALWPAATRRVESDVVLGLSVKGQLMQDVS